MNLDLREVEVYTPTVPVRRTFSQKLADSLSDGWNGFTRGIQNVILDFRRDKREAKKAAQDDEYHRERMKNLK